MDDKFLEDRLANLRDSYNEMPTHKNREIILQNVKEERSKQKKKWIYHLPYVASFIGVGMIAGILLMYFIEQPSNVAHDDQIKSEQAEVKNKASDEEVEKALEELDSFYKKRLKEARGNLGLTADETMMLKTFKSTSNEIKDTHRQSGISKQQLEKIKTFKLNEIDEQFKTPLQRTKEMNSFFNSEKDEEEFAYKYVLTLEKYKQVYQHNILMHQKEIESMVGKEGVEKVNNLLNKPELLSEATPLKKLATGAIEQGYKFHVSLNQISLEIDYANIRKKNNLPKDYQEYFRLQEYPVMNPNKQLVASWKELGAKLVALEKIILNTHTPFLKKRLKDEYGYLYSSLVLGQLKKPVFSGNRLLKNEVKEAYQYIIEQYPNTETAMSLEGEYEELRENNFYKPDNFNYKLVSLPKFMAMGESYEQMRPWIVRNEISPLTYELVSTYQHLVKYKDSSVIGNLNAVQILSLYHFTLIKKDFDTLYLFFDQENLPSKENFLEAIQKDKNDFILNLDEYDHAKYIKDEQLKTEGLQVFFRDETKPVLFKMVKEDQTWKVQYRPFKQ